MLPALIALPLVASTNCSWTLVAEPLMFFTLPLAGSTPPPDSKNAAAVLIAAEHLLSSMLKPVWPATCPAEAKEAVEMVGKVTVVAPEAAAPL